MATDEDDHHVAGGGGGLKLERSIVRLRGVKLVDMCFRMFSRKLIIKYIYQFGKESIISTVVTIY